jgi:hypothetical protein
MKIAVCVPVHGDPKAHFMLSLVEMLIHTMKASITYNGAPTRPDLQMFLERSSLLPVGRTALLRRSIQWGADYALFLDADHTFPADTLLRLLQHDQPVIAVNCATRRVPTSPVAFKWGNDGERLPVYTTEAKAKAGELEPIDLCGLGICLFNMAALNAVHEQAQREGRESIWPMFAVTADESGQDFEGEDFYFFRKLRSAGLPVHLDHAVSWQVGHIAEKLITHRDVVSEV